MRGTRTKEPVPWSKRRLVWIICLLFALQTALILHFPAPLERKMPHSPSETSIRFVRASREPVDEWFHLDDPALFALISPRGFSGSAWLRLPRFPYQLTNTSEPSYWLEASAKHFGNDLDRFLQPENPMPLLALVKPPPTLSEVRFDDSPRAVVPMVRIEGDLVGRHLVSTNSLPQGDPEKASQCIVKVVVNTAGDVVSCVTWSPSGSAIADQQAIAFAQNARFSPAGTDPSAVTLGFLVFHWFAGTLETRSSASQ